jgi:hypothetical protein
MTGKQEEDREAGRGHVSRKKTGKQGKDRETGRG